jgi:hypothetical protein
MRCITRFKRCWMHIILEMRTRQVPKFKYLTQMQDTFRKVLDAYNVGDEDEAGAEGRSVLET